MPMVFLSVECEADAKIGDVKIKIIKNTSTDVIAFFVKIDVSILCFSCHPSASWDPECSKCRLDPSLRWDDNKPATLHPSSVFRRLGIQSRGFQRNFFLF